MATEFRVCWSASSNITFRGESDWEEWTEDGDPEEALSELEHSGEPYNVPPGLEMVLEMSGLEWHVETREARS